MPQKKNPAVGVLKYFSEASLEQASLTFDLAKEVLRSRRKPSTPPTPRKRASVLKEQGTE